MNIYECVFKNKLTRQKIAHPIFWAKQVDENPDYSLHCPLCKVKLYGKGYVLIYKTDGATMQFHKGCAQKILEGYNES